MSEKTKVIITHTVGALVGFSVFVAIKNSLGNAITGTPGALLGGAVGGAIGVLAYFGMATALSKTFNIPGPKL